MKLRLALLFLLLVVFLAAPVRAQPAPSVWNAVVPGVDYQQFRLADPNNIYVVRMDRSNPNLILESSIGQGRLSGGTETVSSMARRYDGAINFWGESWGARNRVVAAINGSYYFASGVPQRGVVHSGWYAKRFTDLQNGTGFGWKLDRSAFIGGCVSHVPNKQIITFLTTGNTLAFQGINVPRDVDELIVYTPQYDVTTLTEAGGVEVLVEMSAPTLILPLPEKTTGIIREILTGAGSTPIPFDHIVLSAHGTAADQLLANAQSVGVGGEIGISQNPRHYQSDCRTDNPDNWAKTYASVGGDFEFLQNGVIEAFPDNRGATARNPRTAIAYNDQYIFFIVVDGRDLLHSVGMSIVELAAFAKNTLGAVWGIAQDGGGSSTLVVNGEVMNFPSDGLPAQSSGGSEKTYLPLVVGGVNSGPPPLPTPLPIVERPVANGMMMVMVEPAARSSAFAPDLPVLAPQGAEIRLGPGTNYAVLASIPPGSEGIIQIHSQGLSGILAKEAYWWKVAFGELVGWVEEGAIQPR